MGRDHYVLGGLSVRPLKDISREKKVTG